MNSILFICALSEEKQSLTEILGPLFYKQCINEALQLDVEQYREKNLDIYVTQSGIGNSNAGAKLALILDKLCIDQVVLIGVAGALHPSLRIGDMVLSSKVIQHDSFSSLEAGHFLMKPGDLILDASQASEKNLFYNHTRVNLSCPHYSTPLLMYLKESQPLATSL